MGSLLPVLIGSITVCACSNANHAYRIKSLSIVICMYYLSVHLTKMLEWMTDFNIFMTSEMKNTLS